MNGLNNEIDVLGDLISRAGSQSEVARFLGISAQAVQQWTKVPLDYALTLSDKYGISLEDFHRQATKAANE